MRTLVFSVCKKSEKRCTLLCPFHPDFSKCGDGLECVRGLVLCSVVLVSYCEFQLSCSAGFVLVFINLFFCEGD
jgi:hypothetical protein